MCLIKQFSALCIQTNVSRTRAVLYSTADVMNMHAVLLYSKSPPYMGLYSYTQRVHRIWDTRCTLIIKESTVYGTHCTLILKESTVYGTHAVLLYSKSPPYMGHTLYSYTQRVHRIWDTRCTLILKESTVYGTHAVLL
jgi:hypothetical protein